MSTARDLITGSLENLGVIEAGETLSADDAKMCLRALNLMMGGWNTQKLLMIGVDIAEFDLTPSIDEYTLGVGGDFDLDAPVFAKAAFVRDNTGIEYPVEIIRDSVKWGEIRDKNMVSSHPCYVFINNNNPLQTVYFHPIPVNTNTIIFHFVRKLSKFTNLSNIAYLPDGYELAIESNLSIYLAPKFGTNVSQEIASIANDSLANIKRANIRATELKIDPFLVKGVSPIINQGTSGNTDNNPFYFGDENNPINGDGRILNQGSEIIFQIWNSTTSTWDFVGSMSL